MRAPCLNLTRSKQGRFLNAIQLHSVRNVVFDPICSVTYRFGADVYIYQSETDKVVSDNGCLDLRAIMRPDQVLLPICFQPD